MKVANRQAIEALRAGVPNASAVRYLGCSQPAIEDRFGELLPELVANALLGIQSPCLLLEGDFGSGKSHLVQWLHHQALGEGFATSRVVIGKETPLSDPHKLFRAAMQALVLPDRLGGGLGEVANRLDFRTPAYTQMYRRVEDAMSRFDDMFRATLFLFERVRSDPEFLGECVEFWNGERITVSHVKQKLRQVGETDFAVRNRPNWALAHQRFLFASELLRAATYAGWVVFLDECEILASLSLVARAKSYATLAALAGGHPSAFPGILLIATFTSEFTGEIFRIREDQRNIPERLGHKYEELTKDAMAGLELIAPDSRWWMQLQKPGPENLERTHRNLGTLYGEAYGWSVPTLISAPLDTGQRSIRQHVRRWITRWDLQRLDPAYEPEVESQTLTPHLDENLGLEETSEEDGERHEEVPEVPREESDRVQSRQWDLRPYLEAIGRSYTRRASFSSFGQTLLRNAPKFLAHVAPKLKIVSGGGKGQGTFTPWIAFLDSRSTSSPMRGLYVVYIFAVDLRSVTLTLNQGVSDLAEVTGWPLACARLAQNASRIRSQLPSDYSADGLSTELDLGVDAKRQEAYQAGNIYSQSYRISDLPPEAELRDDLARFIALYDRAIGLGSATVS